MNRAQLRAIVRREVEHAAQEIVEGALAPYCKQATSWMPQILEARNNPMDMQKTEPGINAARVLRALAASGGDIRQARDFAKVEYGDGAAVTKALAAGDAAAGGFLLQQELASELIDLLRPRSVVRAMLPQVVRARRGSMDFPKLTSGAAAGYIGENHDIPVSQQAFGEVTLTAKKLAALVPISNDLLTFGQDADAIIRDDLIQALATVEDQEFIRGDGVENGPKGLRNWAAAANVTASNGTTSAQIEKDFKDLLQALEGNDVPMIRPGWIMAPRSKNHLITLRDPNGNLIYPEMRNERPTIHTIPVHITNNIPTNLGAGSDETELYLVDASEVLLGEVEVIQIAVSGDASYIDETSTIRSAFTRDQTLMRAILRHDLAVKHDVAVGVKTGVVWGS